MLPVDTGRRYAYPILKHHKSMRYILMISSSGYYLPCYLHIWACIHRQFTLLNLLQHFKHCDSFNRKCGGVKNGGRCFDCSGRVLGLAHTKCTRCILPTEPENQPDFVPVHLMGAWPQIPLILCLVHTESTDRYVYQKYYDMYTSSN